MHSIVSHLLPLQSLGWQGEEDGGPCHGQNHQTLLHRPAASCWHRALPGQPPPLPAALLRPKGEDAFIAWVPASVWVSPPHWLGEGWGSRGQHHAQVVVVTVPTEVAQLGDPHARWAQLTGTAGKGSCEELGAAKPRSLPLAALLCVSTRPSPPQCAQGTGQMPAGVSQESWWVAPTQVVVAQV